MLDKVLLCTDGSEAAGRAVEFASRLLAGSRTTVTLLMALEREALYPPASADGMLLPEMVLPPPAELEEALENRARGILDKAAATLRGEGVSVETSIAWGSAAREIIREAGEGSYDLIILGRHGHGVLRGFLIGSVSDRVVRHSPCPVLVVH